MPVTVQKTAKIIIKGRMTVGEFTELLLQIPPTATINISHYVGNQLDPSYTTLECSWY